MSHNDLISDRTPQLDPEERLIGPEKPKTVQFDKIFISQAVSSQSINSQDSDQVVNENINGFRNNVWRKHSLNIIVIVARFVTYILTNSQKFKLRYLELRQFKVIGDCSSSFDFFVTNRLIRVPKKEQYSPQLKYVYVLLNNITETLKLYIRPIKPDNAMKIMWDSVVFFILLINIVYIPLKISFDLQSVPLGLGFILETIPQYIFIFEIILNFNVAYYSRGVLVMNQLHIMKHYVKGKFILDFIVIIPFMIGRSNVSYIEFVLLFRVSRVMLIFQNLVEQFNLRLNFAALIDIVSLLSTFLFISHIIACVWHFIAQQEMLNGSQTWLQSIQLDGEDWYIRYLASFYWACITTLTIGYGDIVPRTSVERLFVVFVALASSIIFGYTISSIGAIFTQISEQKKYERNKITMINAFVKRRGLTKDLQIKVIKFFEYWLKIQSDKDQECEHLFEHLPGDLNKEVKIAFYRSIIKQSRLFRQNFSEEFIDRLCLIVKEQSFVPEELITSEAQRVDRIYFVVKGEVEAYIKGSRIIKVFKKGQSINDKYFITQNMALYSTRATKFTKLAFIDFTALQELLQNNEEDRQHYFQVKHQIEFRGRVRFQGCELCYQNHDFIQCPFVFYTPNPVRVMMRDIQSQKQKRVYRRRSDHKVNTRQDNIHVRESIFNYGMLNVLFADLDNNHEFFRTNLLTNELNYHRDSRQDEYKSSAFSNGDSFVEDNETQSLKKCIRPTNHKLISKLSKNSLNDNSAEKQYEPSMLQVDLVKSTPRQTPFLKQATGLASQPILDHPKLRSEDIDSGGKIDIKTYSQQLPQIKLIELLYARSIAERCFEIDLHADMEFYNTNYNYSKVIENLLFIKTKRQGGIRRTRNIKRTSSYRTLIYHKSPGLPP